MSKVNKSDQEGKTDMKNAYWCYSSFQRMWHGHAVHKDQNAAQRMSSVWMPTITVF